MTVYSVLTAVSVDILSKEDRTTLKDGDLATLQQERGTQVLHSLAQQMERAREEERKRQREGGTKV